jgi:hypothetical protein
MTERTKLSLWRLDDWNATVDWDWRPRGKWLVLEHDEHVVRVRGTFVDEKRAREYVDRRSERDD